MVCHSNNSFSQLWKNTCPTLNISRWTSKHTEEESCKWREENKRKVLGALANLYDNGSLISQVSYCLHPEVSAYNVEEKIKLNCNTLQFGVVIPPPPLICLEVRMNEKEAQDLLYPIHRTPRRLGRHACIRLVPCSGCPDSPHLFIHLFWWYTPWGDELIVGAKKEACNLLRWMSSLENYFGFVDNGGICLVAYFPIGTRVICDGQRVAVRKKACASLSMEVSSWKIMKRSREDLYIDSNE